MAQAAHSLREITYGIGQVRKPKRAVRKDRREHIEDLLLLYREQDEASELAKTLNELHNIFTKIAHHSVNKAVKRRIEKLRVAVPTFPALSAETFYQLVETLQNVWATSIPQQIPIHERLDTITKGRRKQSHVHELNILLGFNPDARRYFFSIVKVNWIVWLWHNGFLDAIKQPTGDSTQLSYRSPELGYLAKVAETEPAKVVGIMQEVADLEQFNPEVFSRFLDICAKLPADQLKLMVSVIHRKRWLELMAPFDRWGFGCKEMLETLAKAGDGDSILLLASAMLVVRPKAELDKAPAYSLESPFYLKDLSDTGVFEKLVELDEEYIERAFELITKVLGKIASLGNRDKDGLFVLHDRFGFYSENLFTLSLEQSRRGSYREDLKDLAAVAAELTRRTIGAQCDDEKKIKELESKHIATLPDTLAMWRFRLFVWSLCPTVFQEIIEAALFSIFESATAYQKTFGAEYEQLLSQTFTHLTPDLQRKYIETVFTVFGPDKERHDTALRLLSSVQQGVLTDKDIQQSQEVFGQKPNPGYTPRPMVGHTTGGYVADQAPPNSDRVWNGPIPDIVDFFKTTWSPEKIVELDTEKNFLHPINAEGVGQELQRQMKERVADYLAHAPVFFARGELDLHYTYAYLRGVYSLLNDGVVPANTDWQPIFELLAAIRSSSAKPSGEDEQHERQTHRGWLAGWNGVLKAMADVIDLLLGRNADDPRIPFKRYRGELLDSLSFLMTSSDPAPQSSQSNQSEDGRPSRRDLHTAAINSVRGRAYGALMLFLYTDGREFKKSDTVKIKEDARQLIEKIIKREQAEPVMFLIGHHLASLYYRDKRWAREVIVPKIFDEFRSSQNLAAWEGYLSNNLFLDLFADLQDQYRKAIKLAVATFPSEDVAKEHDKALATHMALAFVHASHSLADSDLLNEFWLTPNAYRHGEFIEFIGRHVFSRENADEWIRQKKIDVERLQKLWDWALKSELVSPEALADFGFWIQKGSTVLDTEWLADHVEQTLAKTGGKLEWDHGLIESLPDFVAASSETTLKILDLFLLKGPLIEKRGGYFMAGYDTDLVQIFRTLYRNNVTKVKAEQLIGALVEKYSFWSLKDALKDDKK